MPLWYPLLSFTLLYNTIMVKERGSNRFFSLGSPWKGLCRQPSMGYIPGNRYGTIYCHS